MSLVIASGTLDTVWSEFSLVSFSTSTLADLSACIGEVESKLKRGTIGASTTPSDVDIARWLDRAKQELAETKNYTFRKRYVTAATVASQYRYALPTDYGGGRLSIRDITNDRQILIWDEALFDAKFPDPSEENPDEPSIACIKNMEVWLVPPPAGAYTLELCYDRTGEATATDFTWLPVIERFRVCDFATAESFSSLHDFDKAQFYYTRWEKGIGKAIRADGKRKWARMRYQAISGLQAYIARGNQG
uniref:Uncharacterized protein n=1 Tax=viral metagenome TaxID=1070528 RepID=A0A6M3X9P0_9ZZZZ